MVGIPHSRLMSVFQPLLRIVIITCIAPMLEACAPTDPGTGPGGPVTTTTTLPPCCRTNILMEGTGRALFNPALTMCPHEANFICSVRDDLITDPTEIFINGGTSVAVGPMGTNSFIKLTCRDSDKEWVTPMNVVVNMITCKNDFA